MNPTPNEADRNFLAYQATASPRYLARVFDLVAGELLLLASHLSRDPHTAEDLVQTTFVEAIRCAKRFELKSGVRQWLVGILANHARLEWRRRGRQLDPERVRAEKTQDPDFEVEAREFHEALTKAMAGMPPKYREVLRLSLFHDLTSTEIAAALERPRETVKSQVRRGLQMLKKAMPQGLALGAVVTMLPGRGLSAMKLAVLAEAEAAHAAATAAATAASMAASGVDPAGGFGSWTAWGGAGKKIVAAAMVATVVATVVAVGAWQLWPEQPEVSGSPPAVGGGSRVQSELDAGAGGAGLPDHRTALVGSSKEEDNPRSDRATGELLVRVWFQSDETPAAGAVVSLRPVAETTWLRDTVSRTGSDGTARFAGLVPGDVHVLGGRGGTAEATVLSGRQAQVELVIPPGMEVSGIVKDKAGKALSGVPVCLSPPGHGLDFGVEILQSGADGRFRIRDAEPLRGITAHAPGRVGPRPLYLSGSSSSGSSSSGSEVVLQFRGPGARVRGVVRQPDGKPAVGAAVLVGWSFLPSDTERLPCYPLRTDERGAFLAPGVWTGYDLPVWVKAAGIGGRQTTAVWRGIVSSLEPGEEAFVQVDLRRGGRVHGIVRKEDQPVKGVLVEVLQDNVEEGPGFKFGGPAWARVQTRSAADGSFVLVGVQPGGGKLAAQDPDRPELGHARQGLDLDDGEGIEWNPVLTKGLSILGRVVDPRGAPIPGFRVKLQGPKHTEDRVLYSAADGTFTFAALEDIPYLLTMADKDPVIPNLAVFFEDVRPQAQAKVVDFPIADAARASCHFIGTVVGPQGLPLEGLSISLVHELDGTRKAVAVQAFEYREGRFRVGPVPPATYHVFARSRTHGLIYLGRFEVQSAGQTVDVGTARFQEPGFLSVTVKDPDGRPTAVPSLGITAEGAPAGTRVVLQGGRQEEHRLAPGVYWLEHWDPGYTPYLRRLQVSSGQRVKLDIQLVAGVDVCFRLPPVPLVGTALTLALHAVQAKDDQARGRLVYRQQRIYGHTTKAVSNTLALVPGRYRLIVSNVAGQQAETRFTVTAGGDSQQVQQVDVRFPGAQ